MPKAMLSGLAANKSLLIKVLEYHVVKGEVLAAQVVKLRSAKTLEVRSPFPRAPDGSRGGGDSPQP